MNRLALLQNSKDFCSLKNLAAICKLLLAYSLNQAPSIFVSIKLGNHTQWHMIMTRRWEKKALISLCVYSKKKRTKRSGIQTNMVVVDIMFLLVKRKNSSQFNQSLIVLHSCTGTKLKTIMEACFISQGSLIIQHRATSTSIKECTDLRKKNQSRSRVASMRKKVIEQQM